MKIFLVLTLLLSLISCQEEEQEVPNITKFDLLAYADKIDKNYEILMPTSDKDVIHCSHYYPPCHLAFRVRVLKLPIIVLQYNSHAEAKKSAKKIRGFVFHNWVFDDLTGEPFLMDRFQKVFVGGESFKDYGVDSL